MLGTAVALLPAFGFLFAHDGALQTRPPYQWLGLMTACLIGGFGSVCVAGIFKTVRALPMPPRETTGTGFLSDMAQLFRNPSFVPMFGGAVLVLVGQGATTALNLHAYRYFWELPTAYMQLPLLILPLGMLLGTLAAGVLLRRIEKRDGVVGAITLLGGYQLLITLLAVTGVVPASSMAAVVLVAISGLLFGGCGALCFVCFYSMIADAVDEHDLLFGVRREARRRAPRSGRAARPWPGRPCHSPCASHRGRSARSRCRRDRPAADSPLAARPSPARAASGCRSGNSPPAHRPSPPAHG